jgi:hypothetical protein
MSCVPARILSACLLLAMAGCGAREADAPGAATQRGIDRSVADIQAANAATRGPVEVSRSVGELTGKATATAEGAGAGGAISPVADQAPAPAAG